MRLLNQQGKPQCLLYAAAMVLNEPVDSLIKELGHDGLEIVFPESKAPWRGVHIQEVQDLFMKRGKILAKIDAMPAIGPHDSNSICILYKEPYAGQRIYDYMRKRPGILIGEHDPGKPHAVAWDGNAIYDPNGLIYVASDFAIKEFWMCCNF